MGRRRKRITSEDSETEILPAEISFRASGRVIYWGPYPIALIVSARGTAVKMLYKCPVCGAIYSHSRNWRYHLRSKHPDFIKRMEEASRKVLELYHKRIEEQLRELREETSSVSSVPVSRPSSVPVSRPTSPSVPTFSSGLFELPPPIGPAFRPPSLEELERFMRESEKKGKPPFE